MTWFRCGGGSGMPADLKNRMNAVFNKKFGTAVDYPAEGWPDDVNLMGPLPEATATGSIAHITDGADEVPLKSCEITLPASLDGYSEVNGVRSGKNLVDLSSLVDGYVNSNGTFNTNHSNGEMRSGFIPVKPDTTYYFSIVETTGTAADWVGIGEYTSNDGTGFISRKSFWRFTTSSTTKYVVVSARNLAQATKIQLEIGNDPTTWETYTPIEQYTASLGRTIYGGQVDIVNGAGKDNFASILISETSWTYDSTNARFISADLTGMKNVAIRTLHVMAYGYETIDDARPIGNVPDQAIYNANYERRVIIHDSNYTSVTDFLSAKGNISIIYPLATPTDFAFTPITPTPETALGVNNFWSDAGGDTTVVYRRDIDLALQAVSGSRGLMMASRPAIEPANGDQGSEESSENNIETEGEENAR